MMKISIMFLLVSVFLSGAKSFSLADHSPPMETLCPDNGERVLSQALISRDYITEEPLLMAQNQGKYKCMEECAKDQYQCEQQNKDKPGTKAGNEWSAKCQEQYRGCLDKCK